MVVHTLQYIRTTSSTGNNIVLRFVIVGKVDFRVEGTVFYNGEYVQNALLVTLGSALSTKLVSKDVYI